jgi:segregation and condensation protein B
MELKLILEALLFHTQKPLTVGELRDLLVAAASAEVSDETAPKAFKKVKPDDIAAALAQLEQDHAAAQRSYRLACVAGAWQFASQPEYSPWLRALAGEKARPPRLSQPALETLAIIAYRQPITRAEIEQIRGVSVDGVMQTLLERGLVAPVGRAEVIGRPITFGTTALFLEYFGLRNLDDLPAADELRRIETRKPEALLTVEPGLATAPPEQLVAKPSQDEAASTGAKEDSSEESQKEPA